MGAALEITAVQIGALGLVITAIGALFAVFRSLTSTSETLRKEAVVATDALRKELMAEIEKRDALASRSRHDIANDCQKAITRIDVDVERLKRETVRREDMQAIENRLTTMVGKIESKVDMLMERLSSFAAVEKQVQQIDARLAEALRRVDSLK